MIRSLIIILAIYLSLNSFQVNAQMECGTVASADQIAFMNSVIFNSKSKINARTQNSIVNIPIKAHIVRQSDGTGGLSETQLNSAINTANGFYSNSNIKFSLQGNINFIDNSEFFDFDAADEGKLAVPNDVSKVINVYFFNSITSQGSSLCGYTRFPPSEDRIFMANSCTTSGNTFAHEIGHYFTLYHTHGVTNTGTTDELVDGSNCSSAGDRLCDTPADPNLSGVVNGSCQYTGTAKDANGDFFNPMVSNIMSYAPGSCRSAFTTDQYDRIRAGFENGRSYLNFTSEGFTVLFTSDNNEICIGSTVKYESISFGAVSFSWTFEGGVPATSNLANPQVTYNTPGLYNVTVSATNNNGETVSFSRENYIEVIDPLANSTIDQIDNPFSEPTIPVEWNIENLDKAITFEHNDAIDINNDPNSGCLWVNNFNYSTEVPRNEDVLNFPNYPREGIRGYLITFDYAYSYRKGGFEGSNFIPDIYDTLKVILDDGCFREDVVLWEKGGQELSTVSPISTEFFPNSSADWSSATINYEVSSNASEYGLLKFKNISLNGNNLFIDNLIITPDYNLYAPTNLRAIAESTESVTLKWTDRSLNEIGFIIERSTDGVNFDSIGFVDVNTTEFIDNKISQSSYDYRVTAKGIKGFKSDPSNVYSSVITSISDVSDKTQLKIWPNPTMDKISISGTNAEKCQIINQLGNVVYETPIYKNATTVIDLSKYPKGLYLMRFMNGSKTMSKRVIKN